MVRKTIFLGAIALVAAAFTGNAQAQYPYYYGYPSAPPPSWSYDPYTSGMSACVQWRPSDPDSCARQRTPSYGQPLYYYGR